MATTLPTGEPKEKGPKNGNSPGQGPDTHEFGLPPEVTGGSTYDQAGNQPQGQSASNPWSNSTSGGSASFSRGDDLDPVRQAEQSGGFRYNPHGDSSSSTGVGGGVARSSTDQSKSDSPTSLQDQESNASGSGLARGFNEDNSNSTGRGRARFFTRRRTTIIGVGTTTLVGGTIAFFSVVSGPFEFVHIAQLLLKTHFSNLENASNQEFGKELRYVRSGGDVGETQLGYLGSIMKNNMIGQLEEAGLKPVYNGKTTFEGLSVDTSAENSPFKGMGTEEEIANSLASQGVDPNTFTVTHDPVTNTFTIVPAEPTTLTGQITSNYSNKNSILKYMVSQSGESKIPNALRMRVLKKYLLVDWSPLTTFTNYVNGKVNAAALAAWEAAKNTFLKTGQESANLTTSGALETETYTTPGGTEVTHTSVPLGAGSQDGTVSATKASNILSSIKNSAGTKITGGLAAGVGMLCMVDNANSHIGEIRYAQDFMPLERMGMEAVTVGQNVMSDKTENLSELGVLAKAFTDSKGRGWDSAQTFQADSGVALTGVDMSQGVKDALKEGSPSWLSWITSVPGIGALCSGVGQVVSGIISIGISLFSGDTAGPALGFAVHELDGPVVDNIDHLIAGDAINVAKDAGPAWGNDVNYGVRAFANSAAVSEGGGKLSAAQVATLDSEENATSATQFDSKSLAYRLFNPYDDRSLVSKLIDTQSTNVSQNLSNVASGFLGMGHYLASLPLKLFSSVASAQTPSTYDYPFAEYGFSQSDLDNPLVQDPYANADYVATNLLDKNGQNGVPDYISKAQQCFNVSIVKSSQGKWDVIPGASSDPAALNVYDSSTYNSSDCLSSGDSNWLRIRFFIFDTGLMEGYACEHGDNQSCINDGYSASATSGSPTSGGTNSSTSSSYFTVSGKTISDPNGTYTPAGISIVDDLEQSDWQKPSNQTASDAQIQAAAAYWHVNTIRLQVSEANIMSNPDPSKGYNVAAMQRLQAEVDEIESLNKIPVINDNTEFTDGSQVAPTNRTLAFWKAVTYYFSGLSTTKYSNVILDLYNEPRDISWDIWQKGGDYQGTNYVGMQGLVNFVRILNNSLGSNLIWVEGPQYADSLSQLDNYPINGTNLVFAFHHLNINDPSSWAGDAGLNLKTPVAVVDGEWAQYASTRPECYDQAPKNVPSYLSFLKSNNIGLVAWSLEPGRLVQTNNPQPPVDIVQSWFPNTASGYSQPNTIGSNYACSNDPNVLGQGVGSLIMDYFKGSS